MHFVLYKRHVWRRLFHCYEMKLKLDTKVSLLVVLLAIAICTASTAADGQNSAGSEPPTTAPPAPEQESVDKPSTQKSAEDQEISDAVDIEIAERVRKGVLDELRKVKEEKERKFQTELAARLEEVKQRIQAEVLARLDAEELEKRIPQNQSPPTSEESNQTTETTKTSDTQDRLTPGNYQKQREGTWTWGDMFGFSEGPADSATPKPSAETNTGETKTPKGAPSTPITVITTSYFDRMRTEIPNWFDNFFESLNKTGDKLYKMLEKAAEAIKKPQTDQRSEAVLFLVGCLMLFQVVEWATKTYHGKFQLARKGDNEVYNMTGGDTQFASSSNLMRSLSVVQNNSNFIASLGYALLIYLHPLISLPLLYLYVSVSQQGFKKETWVEAFCNFFKTEHIFLCLCVLLQNMLTLSSSELVTACLITAWNGIQTLFTVPEGQLPTFHIINGTTMSTVFAELRIADKMSADNLFYQFVTDEPLIKLLLLNMMIECIMLVDIQHWHQRPAIPVATGLMCKMKSLFLMGMLGSKMPIQMILRMTPSAVTLHSLSVMFNISWHSLVNPICEVVLDIMQAMSPFEWISWINAANMFQQPSYVNHVFNAFLTKPPADAMRSAAEQNTYFLAVLILILLTVVFYNTWSDKFPHLQTRLFVNAHATAIFPHRPHVHAAMFLNLCLKGMIVFGRPLQVVSVLIAPDVLKQWPQITISMLCVDTVINLVWLAQLILFSIMPCWNSMHQFTYFHVLSGRSYRDKTKPVEHFVIESTARGPMFSCLQLFKFDVDNITYLYHKAENCEEGELRWCQIMLGTFDAATSRTGVMGVTEDGQPKMLTHYDAELWAKDESDKYRVEHKASAIKIADRNTRNMVSTAGMPSVAASIVLYSKPAPSSSGMSRAVGGVVSAAPAAPDNAAMNWDFLWYFFMSFRNKPKLTEYQKATANVTSGCVRFESDSDMALRVSRQRNKSNREMEVFKQGVFKLSKRVAALFALVAIVVICSHPRTRLSGVV